MKDEKIIHEEYNKFADCMEELVLKSPELNIRQLCKSCGKTYESVYLFLRRDDWFAEKWTYLKDLLYKAKQGDMFDKSYSTALRLLHGHTIVKTETVFKRRRDGDGMPLFDEMKNPIMDEETKIITMQEVSPDSKLAAELLKNMEKREGELSREKLDGDTSKLIVVNVVDKRSVKKSTE